MTGLCKCVHMLPAVVVQGAMIPGMEKCDSKLSLRIYSQVLLGLYLVSTNRNIDNAISRLRERDPNQELKLTRLRS